VLDGLFESGQQRRHVARQLAEAIPVLPCHVLQKVKSVISMIFDSAVDAYGRVAPAERLLLPVLLAYALLRGLRYITDDIIAHLRRLWLHLACANPRSSKTRESTVNVAVSGSSPDWTKQKCWFLAGSRVPRNPSGDV
jgi:hypothetical protein